MTSDTQLPRLLAAFVADPGVETLAPIRRVVRRAPNYRPDLVPATVLGPLQRDADHRAVASAARELLPGALLSVSVHLALAGAYVGLDDRVRAQRELAIARAALGGIRATGDGSAVSPWSVLRLSDEYDVLRALGTTSTGQQVLTVGDRSLDRHDGADGTTYHFDVTGML